MSICLAGCGVMTPQSQTAATTSAATTATPQAADNTSATTTPVAHTMPTTPDIPITSPQDYIYGVDASSVLVEENSGVRYYDFAGNEADVFQTLAQSGINYIRLRVWNDPYDEEGHGYGGGNNDLETAITLGKRATDNGMRVCIDFHYSDFWADPKRQHVPKAWEGMDIDEKCVAIQDYTQESLDQLFEAGVDVGIVQIGNEINYGMSGETDYRNVIRLLTAAAGSVRKAALEHESDTRIAVHYTNVRNKAEVDGLMKKLTSAEVDFDILGLSYYPFWDSAMDNMARVVELMTERYGKQVMLAETSYPYTMEDGDGAGNSVSSSKDLVEGYPASVEGQKEMIRKVYETAREHGSIGAFYWEGTWIPVGPKTQNHSDTWETYGSGWASSYAGDYDPEDAGKYYGGCSWDNQALFDFEGHPLDSLKVFEEMRQEAE